MEPKGWGKNEYWGLGYEWDPQWHLTDKQKELQKKLIELCRTVIRPNAVVCDHTYEYPRKSLNALADMGLLGLIVPKSLGGLGESHVCAAMVVETIARYGCPSTAMVYVMHVVACALILFRHHDNETVKDLLRKLDKEKMVGTASYSDPATGGHFWFPISSKVRTVNDNQYKMLKYGSWATSAGHADWYAIACSSPDVEADYSNLSSFLLFKNEVRANTDDWSALGMHGNQSGPLVCEAVLTKDRLVGLPGDVADSNDEIANPFFLLLTSACWNGISMGAIDIAKKHVTRKAHADMGIRVCDYPSIQDYFGESVSDTNICRFGLFDVAAGLDGATDNNDWSAHADRTHLPRSRFLFSLWQIKLTAAKNVSHVTDTMLHACGGTGYKTDLGIERLLRDGKAGWVMGPSNEVLKQYTGKTVLYGAQSIDYWEKNCHQRVLHHELGKLNTEEKQKLVNSLTHEIKMESGQVKKLHAYQDEDFYNPFNTQPPAVNDKVFSTKDGNKHGPGLHPTEYRKLKLLKKTNMSDKLASFTFALPNPTDHLGCIAGQYVQARIPRQNGTPSQERYFSPVSTPNDYGRMELVLRYETQGILSKYFKGVEPGCEVEFRGPKGGYEYTANSTDGLVLFASGGGLTPCMQLIRTIMADPDDKTNVTLMYYSDNFEEILFKDELDRYEKNDCRLKVIHSLGECPENWDGEEGFIDDTMVGKYVPVSNGRKYKMMICGGPTMVLSLLYSLKQCNIESRDIFVFGAFGMEQVKLVYGRNCVLGTHKS